mmetsp:Transcript_15416/g.23100  ORF Transcript_15416/g.23100 Transcript_15416/m.23100 type:complete len:314 (+) Transcript_15416:65-1006(+)
MAAYQKNHISSRNSKACLLFVILHILIPYGTTAIIDKNCTSSGDCLQREDYSSVCCGGICYYEEIDDGWGSPPICESPVHDPCGPWPFGCPWHDCLCIGGFQASYPCCGSVFWPDLPIDQQKNAVCCDGEVKPANYCCDSGLICDGACCGDICCDYCYDCLKVEGGKGVCCDKENFTPCPSERNPGCCDTSCLPGSECDKRVNQCTQDGCCPSDRVCGRDSELRIQYADGHCCDEDQICSDGECKPPLQKRPWFIAVMVVVSLFVLCAIILLLRTEKGKKFLRCLRTTISCANKGIQTEDQLREASSLIQNSS